MKLRAALTAAIVVPSAIALTGPVAPTYAAAAVCQGQPATIEGSTGTITGTEGNDVIVSTGLDRRHPRPGRQRPHLRRRRRRVHRARATTRSSRRLAPGLTTASTCSAATTPTSADRGPATSSSTRSAPSTSSSAAAGPWNCSRPRRLAPAPSTSVRRAASSTPSGRSRRKVDLSAQTASVDGLLSRHDDRTAQRHGDRLQGPDEGQRQGTTSTPTATTSWSRAATAGTCWVGSATASTSICPSAGATSRCSAARPAPTVSPAGSATTC